MALMNVMLPGDKLMLKKIMIQVAAILLLYCPAMAGFVNNGNGTVTDTATGLTWQQATAPGTYTWEQALAYCEGLTLGGRSDWRLPTLKELRSIVDYSRYNPAINTDFFPDTAASWYWSSTTYAHYTDYAWDVDFYYGYDNRYNKLSSGYVRAVRGGQSGSFGYSAILQGAVAEIDGQGNILGMLSGVDVQLSSGNSSVTGSQGEFLFQNLPAGSVTVTASKAGYHPQTQTFALASGMTKSTIFFLAAQSGATETPDAFNFQSPQGKHFIENMPGNLTFNTMIAWNGPPGTVRFKVNGQWVTAPTTDMGGGLARAELTVSAPTAIYSCSELTIEVTNGSGKKRYVNMGVHFSPVLGAIPWYQDSNIPWDAALSYSDGWTWNKQYATPGGHVSISPSWGYGRQVKYDPLSATLSGSLSLNGGVSFKIPTPQPGLKVLAGLGLEGKGGLAASLAGCGRPTVTPSWTASLNGKLGLEAPVVLAVDVIVIGLGSTLAVIPIIKEIKLQVYMKMKGGITGKYTDFQTGNHWLGATDLIVSVGGGPEATILVENRWAKTKAGVTVGGDGTWNYSNWPDCDGFTGRMYARAFAEVCGLAYNKEVGAEIAWDFTGKAAVRAMTDLKAASSGGTWQPIGKTPRKWGEVNRLAKDPVVLRKSDGGLETTEASLGEERLVENVIWTANPSVFADDSTATILYARHDTEKPWHAATDIAKMDQTGAGPWVMDQITDDLAAEFSPELAPMDAETLLAAWTRVEGDVSEAETPEDIVPHLEIVCAWQDRTTGAWGPVQQLTANAVVDRDPLPVRFSATQGVIWIQNQGLSMIGNATEGDRLLYREWSGSDWSAPQVLWADQKGMVKVAFAGDNVGQGHVVFAVDEDGDLETMDDIELYQISTVAGIWQAAVRLTNDAVEDALPVLVEMDADPLLVWKSGEQLHYTFLSAWDPKVVHPESETEGDVPTLDGVAMPGGAAVAWAAQSPDGMDIMAAFYDTALDQWSLPRQLTFDEDAESSLSMAFDGHELVIAYLKTQTLREAVEVEIDGQMQIIEDVPQPGRTDLCVLRHTLGHDPALAADAVALTPANPAPGGFVDVRVTVLNNGDLALENLPVAVYDGDPAAAGVFVKEALMEGPLAGGYAEDVVISFELPAGDNPHQFFVVVDPGLTVDDRNRANNTASVWTTLPNLKVESADSDPVSPTALVLTATVVNAGVIPSGEVTVSWRLNDGEGPEIGRTTAASIPPGAASDITCLWEVEPPIQPNQFVPVWITVDPDDAVLETDETDNTALQSVKTPMYTDQVGSLTVFIQPPEAEAAGVQWSIDGGANWHDGGVTLTVPAGNYTIIFSDAGGWSLPSIPETLVETGQSTVIGHDTNGTISGTVYESDGTTPITGKEISIWFLQGDPCGSYDWIGAKAINTADGTYTATGLSPGDYYLLTHTNENYIDEWWANSNSVRSCDNAQAISLGPGESITGKDFQLDPGATISGTIFESDGSTPLTGAMIWLGGYAGDPDPCYNANQVAQGSYNSSNGAYTLNGFPTGTYFLVASSNNNNSNGNYFSEWWASPESVRDCSAAQGIFIEEGQALTNYNFQLDPGASISGTVYQSDGVTPLSGECMYVGIYAKDDPCDMKFGVRYTNTDYNGGYYLGGLLPGTYYVVTRAEGDGMFCFGFDVVNEWWAAPASVRHCDAAQSIVIADAEIISGIDFQLENGAGDVNNDQQVNFADAVLALQILSGITPSSPVLLEADINEDGKIGMEEVIYILETAAGVR